jgi:hypothetical protein
MWRLKTADPNVQIVVETSSGNSVKRWYFHDGTVQTGQQRHFATELESPDTYYLVDGTPPLSSTDQRKARTLQVSSPLKSRYQAFAKEGPTMMLYMPTWSWYEMKAARTAVFPSYDEQQAKRNIRIAGGVIRLVLDKPSRDPQFNLESHMQEGVARSDLVKILNSSGALGHGEEVSDQVVHFVEASDEPTYRDYVLDWASK